MNREDKDLNYLVRAIGADLEMRVGGVEVVEGQTFITKGQITNAVGQYVMVKEKLYRVLVHKAERIMNKQDERTQDATN